MVVAGPGRCRPWRLYPTGSEVILDSLAQDIETVVLERVDGQEIAAIEMPIIAIARQVAIAVATMAVKNEAVVYPGVITEAIAEAQAGACRECGLGPFHARNGSRREQQLPVRQSAAIQQQADKIAHFPRRGIDATEGPENHVPVGDGAATVAIIAGREPAPGFIIKIKARMIHGKRHKQFLVDEFLVLAAADPFQGIGGKTGTGVSVRVVQTRWPADLAGLRRERECFLQTQRRRVAVIEFGLCEAGQPGAVFEQLRNRYRSFPGPRIAERRIGSQLFQRGIQRQEPLLPGEQQGQGGKGLGDRTDPIQGIGACRLPAVDIPHTESTTPDQPVVADQRQGDAGHGFALADAFQRIQQPA